MRFCPCLENFLTITKLKPFEYLNSPDLASYNFTLVPLVKMKVKFGTECAIYLLI